MSFWIIKLIYFIYRSILLRLASPMVLLASIYVEIIKIDVHPVCGNKRWADSSSGLTEKIVIKVKKKKKKIHWQMLFLLILKINVIPVDE